MSTVPETAEPPEDRFCDLVMKGGITSGVVYPKAIGLLAKHYRFKSIGGTSAGAVAAVITAAAEYQRRNKDTRAGFEVLEELPKKLGDSVGNTRRSKLISLFQPQPETRRLFSVLMRSLNAGGTLRRVFWIITGFILAYWPATAVSLIAAVATGLYGPGWFTAFLLLLVALPGLIGLWVYFDITRGVVDNGFGLCTGMSPDREHPALTQWLHEQIQDAAGLDETEPLTFGDLWTARGFPKWLDQPEEKRRSIDLQMFSTNLAHGRPYIFPLAPRDATESRFRARDRLYFRPDELERYLPEDVMTCLRRHGTPYRVEKGREGRDPDQAKGEGLLELPDPAHFPYCLQRA